MIEKKISLSYTNVMDFPFAFVYLTSDFPDLVLIERKTSGTDLLYL